MIWYEYFNRYQGARSKEDGPVYEDFQSQVEEVSQKEDVTAFLFDNWKSDYPDTTSQLGSAEGTGGKGFEELETYLSEPSCRTTNPVEWWIASKDCFPTLSKLALDIHAIPAMSTECERVFSKYVPPVIENPY
ncbi:MAG: hAT family dimerization domain-containing protein [Paenibacillus sp.]|uniref:hAT family dimerization domain-containing protein n=1 Tax=Paenibacillus sp. TaxID=58172 RepID=UPI003B75F3D3